MSGAGADAQAGDAALSEWDQWLDSLGVSPSDAGGLDASFPRAGECGECIGACFFGLCIPAEPGAADAGPRPPATAADDSDAGEDEMTPSKVADGGWCLAADECQSKVCGAGICLAARCDDGVCNGDETTASCSSDCGSYCGDGAVNGEETCDDSNGAAGDGCSDKCLKEDGFACSEGAPSACTQIDACLDAPCGNAEALSVTQAALRLGLSAAALASPTNCPVSAGGC